MGDRAALRRFVRHGRMKADGVAAGATCHVARGNAVPMSQEILMPRLSDTMEEGTISRWLKHEGDHVEKGEILVEIETDKANMEYPAFSAGTLQKLLAQEGQTVKIGEAIALIGDSAASADSDADGASRATSEGKAAATAAEGHGPSSVEAPAPQPGDEALAAQSARPTSSGVVTREGGAGRDTHGPQQSDEVSYNGERVKASPLARKVAAEQGIDLKQVKGTGPGGRIIREDVVNYRPPAPSALPSRPTPPVPPPDRPALAGTWQGSQLKPLTRMQQVIARRMVESKTQVPHFYVTNEVDMEEADDLRRRLNAGLEKEQQVRLDAVIIRACALALVKFPVVNASYRDGQFEYHDYVHVGFAVSLPEGLVVPVVRDCDKKGVRQIDQEMRPLIERSRAGKLSPADMEHSTFSVSNLGMYDVDEFDAVVNPPNAAILAVGATKLVPAVVDGQLAIRKRMKLTLSCDHRILYGAPGAQFLQELKRILQSPYSLVL